MPGIVIQNVPFSGKNGNPVRTVRTQFGGNYVHHHGIGATVRQAAYDALVMLSPVYFKKHHEVIAKMIGELEDADERGSFEVKISIPANIGPRFYLNGKYHPGTPDVIDLSMIVATASDSIISPWPLHIPGLPKVS